MGAAHIKIQLIFKLVAKNTNHCRDIYAPNGHIAFRRDYTALVDTQLTIELLESIINSSFCQIVGGHFYLYLIAD